MQGLDRKSRSGEPNRRLRRCCGCYEMKPKAQLIRIVRNLDGKILLDLTGKADGRGAYLCRGDECLKKARKRRGLERSFKRTVPSEIYDELEAQLNA